MKPFFQDKKESRIHRFETLDYAPHLHSALEIGFLTEGESLLRLEDETYSIRNGDFFVIFPNLIHSFGESRNAKGYFAIFTSDDLGPFLSPLSEQRPADPILPKELWSKESSLQSLFELSHKDFPKATNEVKKGYARTIVGLLLPMLRLEARDGNKNSALREILTYLSTHSTENISRKSLARALGISESSISHIFSHTLKISLPSYLNSLRLDEAQALLKETELSITQIVSQSGFGSLRSFNRAFRAAFGISPTEYRKEQRKE